jgi:PncC family amidohydrolase
VKLNLLGVNNASLIQHGAVSEVVAAEMAVGVRRLLGVEIGISVTGIAGPTGGSVDKPVGLTFMGLSAPDLNSPRVIRREWTADRIGNKQLSADAALWLVIDYLEGRTSHTR